jgi:hypothetical protein
MNALSQAVTADYLETASFGGCLLVVSPASPVTIHSSAFINCSASRGGGAFIEAASATVARTLFDSCIGRQGGGLCCESDACVIVDCVFEKNAVVTADSSSLSLVSPNSQDQVRIATHRMCN